MACAQQCKQYGQTAAWQNSQNTEPVTSHPGEKETRDLCQLVCVCKPMLHSDKISAMPTSICLAFANCQSRWCNSEHAWLSSCSRKRFKWLEQEEQACAADQASFHCTPTQLNENNGAGEPSEADPRELLVQHVWKQMSISLAFYLILITSWSSSSSCMTSCTQLIWSIDEH